MNMELYIVIKNMGGSYNARAKTVASLSVTNLGMFCV